MEASTPVQTPQRPSRPEPVETEPATGPDLIKKLADPKGAEKASEGEKMDALEWFLSDDSDAFTHTMELNVGTPNKPKWIGWEMKPVDLDTLRRIRRQAAGNRKSRRDNNGEIDEVEANLRIVVEGTVSPDMKEVAKAKGILDPADALRFKFQHKPGLLGQIAGEIMALSGYDDEDLREVDAAGG